jgi:hypothetical protein
MSILSTANFEEYSLLLLQEIAGASGGVEVQSNMSTAVYRQNTLTLLQYIAANGISGGTGATGATGVQGPSGLPGTSAPTWAPNLAYTTGAIVTFP